MATLVSKVEKGCFGILVTSCRVVKDDKSIMPLEPTWMGMKVAIYPFSFGLTIMDSYLELLHSAPIEMDVSNEMVSSAKKITCWLSFHHTRSGRRSVGTM